MNQDVTQTLHEVIRKQLHQSDFDVVGIVPIPAHTDRMIRLRTLQEMIEDFDESRGNDTIDYLLQIKPRREQQSSPWIDLSTLKSAPEHIYLPNGKLNAAYLLKNAEVLFDAGEYALAKNIYTALLKAGESTSTALYRMGRCFEAEGKNDAALAHFEESIAYHPTLECFQKIGALLVRQNKDLNAAEVYERALHLKELSSQSRFDLYQLAGNCWARAKKVENAEKNFKKALEICPTADEIRSSLGALYLQIHKVPEAKRHFRDAVASNPKNHDALTGLGSCSLLENDKKAAHDYFVQALKLNLNQPNAIFQLVRCAYELKSYATAARLLEEYIQVSPVNPNVLYSLAGLQFHLGRISDAKETTAKTLALQPNHEGARDLFKMIEQYSSPSIR